MDKSKTMIGLIQHTCSSNKEENIAKATGMIRKAAAGGAKIICTQELFATHYFCQTVDPASYDLAEPIPGPTSDSMQALARELKVVIICCVFEYAMDGVYFTSAVVFDADGTNLGTYRKHHIPEGPQYYEKYYFTPGDSGYKVFKSAYGTFGVLICWDQWFPEATRIVALKGADLVFYPSIIGEEPDDPGLDTCQNWMDAVKGHGIHNNIYVAALNRPGREYAEDGSGSMTFYGKSFMADPWGNIVSQGSRDTDDIILAQIDQCVVEKARDRFPFMKSRRPEAYGDILKLTI